MGDPLFLIAVTGLSLSGIVSAIRLIDWFLHSDPKLIAHTGRWAALVLALVSLPVLIGLLFAEKWTAAIALAAAMLLGIALYGPRLLATLLPRRLVLDQSQTTGRSSVHSSEGELAANHDLVERSIAVLEEYLRRSAGLPKPAGTGLRADATARANGNGRDRAPGPSAMSQTEALDILGLAAGATDEDINDAHRRLVQMIHPDRGGSHYLTVKINQAKDVLLGQISASAETPRKPKRRRASRRQELDPPAPSN